MPAHQVSNENKRQPNHDEHLLDHHSLLLLYPHQRQPGRDRYYVCYVWHTEEARDHKENAHGYDVLF